MVGIASFAGMVTTLLITILVPIILAIVLYRHKKYSVISILVGALVFFVSQVILRMPLLSGLALTDFHAKYSSNAVNNIVIGFMINNGSYEEMMAPALGAQAAEIQDALINTPAPHFFLAGFERLSAMSVHIGLSVLVCLAVLAKKPILLLLAILFHGLVNAPAALMNSLGLNIYLVEGLILIMAIAAAIFAIKSRQKFASYA
ncbi:MAG: YhfC family glutamic-type intramembrane protease [Eubacteriales bacterium]|nr:YhfC family glutamic-type intramembrane protease [Eubacteriales bacterium]MDD3198486.1 YhfC family glutamic-type intramembrane protease [Eubacteriales bacterium]MDD4683472.1 YhfC family glutamic-type intramembrane protease [Eubacteriales bacterium]